MDQISVTNFRKFYYVTPRHLNDINIFVGGNNSGKSTLVKAILLAADNIRTMRMGGSENFKTPQFRFDANQYHDVKIGTYTRALCHKPEYAMGKPDSNGNKIEFAFVIGDYEFELEITGDEKGNEPFATVNRLAVVNMKYGFRFLYWAEENLLLAQMLFDPKEKRDLLWELASKHLDIIERLNKASEDGNLSEITKLNSDLDKIIGQIIPVLKELHIPEDDEEEDDEFWLDEYRLEDTDLSEIPGMTPPKPVTQFMHRLFIDSFSDSVDRNMNFHKHSKADVGFLLNTETLANDDFLICEMMTQFINTLKPMKFTDKDKESDIDVEAHQMMQQELPNFEKFRDGLRSLLNSINIEYISAHSANQNVIYSTVDKNDHIAKAIHDFYSEKILKGSQEALFVQKWMKELGVGEDYEITPIQGEAYTVDIKEKYISEDEEHEDHVNLADKGMGSIQVMVMLFRIAATLRRFNLVNKTQKDIAYKPIIVIEEPEQNLHPNIQSKLADLFKAVSEKYHCRFIIESHSEYLIRRIQCLVGEEKYATEKDLVANNPFEIMEFKANDDPEIMEFYTTGGFKEKFGEGFLDEASRLDMEIIRNERGQKRRR